MNNIAIFASGNGSNAQRIAEYFRSSGDINISIIISNNKDAYVLERAHSLGLPALVFSSAEFRETSQVLKTLRDYSTDYIILAGFLLLVPEEIIKCYPGRILNIHPALLPKYGGKGMYGHHVHQAVIDSGDKESGISIHIVNERFDEGNLVFQAVCPVIPGDTADSLASRVHQLEYLHFPRVIEEYIRRQHPG